MMKSDVDTFILMNDFCTLLLNLIFVSKRYSSVLFYLFNINSRVVSRKGVPLTQWSIFSLAIFQWINFYYIYNFCTFRFEQ